MANKKTFKSAPKGQTIPATTTTNKAGGRAYKLGEKAALAQYAATGTFNDTFYTKGADQVDEVLAIAAKCTPEFIGKVIVYSREQGRMKDMPALLSAHLATRGPEGMGVLRLVFGTAINSGKMLRNFAQMIRSGKLGRKSFGTAPKKLVQSWFNSRSPEQIFKQSVGNDPSLADVIKLTRVQDLGSPERKAFYQYLLDKEHEFDLLPSVVKEYELLKKRQASTPRQVRFELTSLPKVPWEMLSGLAMDAHEWKLLAEQATWTQLRMSLNTLSRHGVFKDDALTKVLAAKLKDPELIRKAKPFPYQLMVTYLHTEETGEEAVPRAMRNALHDALDIATECTPMIDGAAHALIDVSGSMQSPVTGHRAGATSKARCIDVAALIGSAFLRKSQESTIVAYSDNAITNHGCEPRDSVMTNAKRLAAIGGGGTNLGAAFAHLNKTKAKGDLVLVASDMETWADDQGRSNPWGGTVSAAAWAEYKGRNPKAKLVCINLAAGDTCQVANNKDVLNIGGFSDSLWEVIKSFVEGMPSADHWVKTIEDIKLPEPAAKTAVTAL